MALTLKVSDVYSEVKPEMLLESKPKVLEPFLFY